MTRRLAWGLLWAQLVLLLLGTQMPGAWRAGIEASLHALFSLSAWAHFVMFVGMAWVTHRHLAWPWHRVLLAALALALLSEGLQFFALDRHPSMLDVGIDMAGAGLGLLAVQAWMRIEGSPSARV